MASPRDDSAQSKDGGWVVGVRQTVERPIGEVWSFLIGPGLALWLGDTTLPTEINKVYETDDGVRGRILKFVEGTRVRLSWHPSDWPHDTTLQLSVKPAEGGGTTIRIVHERLADREERRMMLGHWKNVVAELEKAIGDL